MTFEELKFKTHPIGTGVQAVTFFPNGYGASVVKFDLGLGGSYGCKEDLWELAVIRGNKKSFKLVYDTPITDDVLGYLTEDDITRILGEIGKL